MNPTPNVCMAVLLNAFVMINANCIYGQNEKPADTKSNNFAEWTGAYLNIAGGNTAKGIEVSTKSEKCGSDDMILIRFTNHNKYPVEVEWADAFYTMNKEWKHDERQNKEKLITLQPGMSVTGSCADANDKNLAQLIVKSSEIIENPDDFYKYAPSYFVVLEKSK